MDCPPCLQKCNLCFILEPHWGELDPNLALTESLAGFILVLVVSLLLWLFGVTDSVVGVFGSGGDLVVDGLTCLVNWLVFSQIMNMNTIIISDLD